MNVSVSRHSSVCIISVVVMGKDAPVLVNSEEERRLVTGEGTEISWSVMKNFLTIRHSLAQTGVGLSATSEAGENSPFASGTSVFMGWSLSKQEGDVWVWEDLGYWDTLAAAAWTGWCAMKAGDECSNYFVHEIGHAQTMQHFDAGSASKWGIEDEYPFDGVYTPKLPWGYDSVSRQFRTWVDPLDGTGKKDPLNGEGEPPYSQSVNCFSQYTPYQAQLSQNWAMSTPILLSASTSEVPLDGAYQFNPTRHQYMQLNGQDLIDATGVSVMEPDEVGVPVVTLIGTVGVERDVCQTYPSLRGHGNTFNFPDPFVKGLPPQFNGASYFVEVRFEDGHREKALIAAKYDATAKKALAFYSFNIAIRRRPIAVDLYRFSDNSYPSVSVQSKTELLHIRPIELPSENPLAGLPPLLRVGRGWLGDSSQPNVHEFCITEDECNSERHTIEWRSDIGSENIVYRSTLSSETNGGATLFKVPTRRQWDSKEYTITVLATRFYNDGKGTSPLLSAGPFTDDGSSDIDATHGIRIWAPWELNESIPVGIYHSLPGVFKISAEAAGGNSRQPLLELDVSLNIGTITAPPTSAPTKRPSSGPTPSPVPVRYHIEWKVGTCVTEGESSEWAPPYLTKEDCCNAHMAYEFNLCMSRSE